MEFALTKVYTKFYISQILNSASYQEVKNNQAMLDKFFEENEDMNDGEFRTPKPIKSAKKEPVFNDSKFRKLFRYGGVYYSKVEIMGLVVEMQTWGPDDKVRYILYIDDGTGLIQTIVWKNYNKGLYEKVQESVVSTYVLTNRTQGSC
jgi:hypothetical protein